MALGTPIGVRNAVPVRWRRNARLLTPGQVTLLRQAFSASMGISDDRGYQYWAGIHGLPRPIGCDNAHGRPHFLPWHRAYLYFFERTLRDQVPDAELTWWDWTVPSIPPIFEAPQDEAGGDNPLYSAPVDPVALQQGRDASPPIDIAPNTLRQPGLGAVRALPTTPEVDEVLDTEDFLEFSSKVEDLHGAVHMWTGGPDGHMSVIAFAAFDPIFWAHHCMIDRLWRMWQLLHPGALPPDAIIDDALPPFDMTIRQTLDVTALGYDYAAATSSTPVT